MTLTAARIGPYEVIERIGIGGMAEVFKASLAGEEGFERLVAVKRILPGIAEDQDFVAMFIDEAKIAVQLSHPNIAQIYDLGRDDDTYYIAQEYVHGRDMEAIYKRQSESGTPLPVPFVLHIATKICEALSHAHEATGPGGRPLNLIHRDISPSNILVSFEGAVKVIDFGLAKAAGRAVTTQAGMVKGKLAYLSSEQARGYEIDSRSDLFSLGTCMWEWLTGERLFRRANDVDTVVAVQKAKVPPIRTRRPDVPAALDEIVMKALQPDPQRRVQSAGEMHELLLSCAYENRLLLRRNAFAEYVRALFPEDRDIDPAAVRGAREPSAPMPRVSRHDDDAAILLDRPKSAPPAGPSTFPPPRSDMRPAGGVQRFGRPREDDRPARESYEPPARDAFEPAPPPADFQPGRFAGAAQVPDDDPFDTLNYAGDDYAHSFADPTVDSPPMDAQPFGAPGPEDIRAFAERAGFEVEDGPQLAASVIGLDDDSSDDSFIDVLDDEVEFDDETRAGTGDDLFPSFSEADALDDESWPTDSTRTGDESDQLAESLRSRPRTAETALGGRPRSIETKPSKQVRKKDKQTEGAPLIGRFRAGRPILDSPSSADHTLTTDSVEELLPPTPSVVERELRPRTGEVDFDDETFTLQPGSELSAQLAELRQAAERSTRESETPEAAGAPARHFYEPEDYSPKDEAAKPITAPQIVLEAAELPRLGRPLTQETAIPQIEVPRVGLEGVPSAPIRSGIDADDLFGDLTNSGQTGSEALADAAFAAQEAAGGPEVEPTFATDEVTGTVSPERDTLPPGAVESDSIEAAIDQAILRLERANRATSESVLPEARPTAEEAFPDVPTATLDSDPGGETSDDIARELGGFDLDEATSIEPSLLDLSKLRDPKG